jgi:starvation-inducible DNA-binding protein
MSVRVALFAGAQRDSTAALRAGDGGTNDLLVSQVIRTNKLQVCFLAEHLVDLSLARAD